MAGIPGPDDGILRRMESLGSVRGQKRWGSRCRTTGRLFTWDSLHRETEVYNKRGWHLGVMDPQGRFIKMAVKGRKIDV